MHQQMSPRVTARRRGIGDPVQRVLRTLRTYLGLDVAFVSQFSGHDRVFRYVDTELDPCPVEVGASQPLDQSYCHKVVRGELPQLMRDPAAHPGTKGLAVAGRLPAGTHLIVPVRFSDGSVYGALSCLALRATGALGRRELSLAHVMADVVAHHLEEHGQVHEDHRRRRERLGAITGGRDLLMVFQPIMRLDHLEVVGLEALARFPALDEGPAQLFAEARSQGAGTELELKAVEAALEHMPQLPDGAYLSVNVSPTTLTEREFQQAVSAAAPERIVVEITEHAVVQDYEHLLVAVRTLRDLGVRLAIDDVGTGISGLNHILRLSPDVIKIDAALVRGIHSSTPKQAMISALSTFAARMGIAVVAEGIETAPELQTLRVLGIAYGQGFLLSRPVEHPDTLASAHPHRGAG